MRKLTQESFDTVLQNAGIRARTRNEVRFHKYVDTMSAQDWEETELLAVTDRTEAKGVLLFSFDDAVYATPYEISRGITSKTGRAQAIICDFCRTWQTGSRSGSITFTKDKRAGRSISFLCCADLQCSQHVRTKTGASKTSRAQLREDLSDEQRVERLKARLKEMVERLNLTAS